MSRIKLGIDAGGTLLKIAYEEGGRLHFKKFPTVEAGGAVTWIKMSQPDASVTLTGGKAELLKRHFFSSARVVPEFAASCTGADFLQKQSKALIEGKYLLVNIGTGTSFYIVDGYKHERVLGSGLGGGSFLGLGCLLTGESEFAKLVQLATAGEKGNADLLVKDVYTPAEPPIDGNLTAANFANSNIKGSSAGDRAASLINMIAETLILLGVQTASLHKTKHVAFIGSTLSANLPMKNALKHFAQMTGLQSIFIPNGEYSGAVGALMLDDK
ncbi:type II pantothenate kinase [Mesobacillus harenae]|uniref:type II pantothenate kinase n=1 Tax=Mesobacillus harenae TaxID=2213203 RepID=UPI00157FEC60|nr:type II pantothenate kinase [Mesobacillus harenae]